MYDNITDSLAYDGWLKIFLRKLNGRTYEILKDRNAVSAIILNEKNELLLVKQFRPALMRETLEIPAGTMDREYEDGIRCLMREVYEETGLAVSPSEVEPAVTYMPNMGFSNSLMKMYIIRLTTAGLKTWAVNDCDVREARWMSQDELFRLISAGEITDVKTLVAYLHVKAISNPKVTRP